MSKEGGTVAVRWEVKEEGVKNLLRGQGKGQFGGGTSLPWTKGWEGGRGRLEKELAFGGREKKVCFDQKGIRKQKEELNKTKEQEAACKPRWDGGASNLSRGSMEMAKTQKSSPCWEKMRNERR